MSEFGVKANWPIFNSIQHQLAEFDNEPEDFVQAPIAEIFKVQAMPATAEVKVQLLLPGRTEEELPQAAPQIITAAVAESDISVEWLGLTDYVKAIQAQDEKRARIIGLEHPSTITLGKRGDPLKDIKVSVKVLRQKQIAIVAVDRGGQATLHSQGQLVIYPVINLREHGLGVREYVTLLEDVTIRFLADYGIKSFRQGDEPGLYTSKGKIAFLGVRIRRGWTSHGISINVRNDLSEFLCIRSCGIEGATFAKMADFDVNAPLSMLFEVWSHYFLTALHLTQDARRPMVASSFSLRV